LPVEIVLPNLEQEENLNKTESEESPSSKDTKEKQEAPTPTGANLDKRITVLIDSYKKTPLFNNNFISPENNNNDSEGFHIRKTVNMEPVKENKYEKHFPSFKMRVSELYSNKQMRDIRSEIKRQKRSKNEILKSMKETLIYINSLKLTIEEVNY
jgi:hypothetical protein